MRGYSSGAAPASSTLRLFEPVLALLRDDLATSLRTQGASLVPIAYEERRFSHLLRVAVRNVDRPDLSFFVKIFKSEADPGGIDKTRLRVAHDFEVTRRLSTAMAGSPQGGIVRPVACYVEHLAIITEQADGMTLLTYLKHHAAWFPAASAKRHMRGTLAAVGRWLQRFQSIDRDAGRVSLTELREYVDVRLKRLVNTGVFSATDRKRVLRHLLALGGRVFEQELDDVLIHADFGPGNILVSGPRVVVLDLAMVQRGCALHDISRLYVHLDAMRGKPQFRTPTIRALQLALLQGFDPSLTPDRPLFRFLVMLHRINHLSMLSRSRERLPADVLNGRVRRIHRRWIEGELRSTAHVVAQFRQ
jgi:hypothetical protein